MTRSRGVVALAVECSRARSTVSSTSARRRCLRLASVPLSLLLGFAACTAARTPVLPAAWSQATWFEIARGGEDVRVLCNTGTPDTVWLQLDAGAEALGRLRGVELEDASGSTLWSSRGTRPLVLGKGAVGYQIDEDTILSYEELACSGDFFDWVESIEGGCVHVDFLGAPVTLDLHSGLHLVHAVTLD